MKLDNPNPEVPNLETPKRTGNTYYDSMWRWIEDTYLKYFGENRTSYGVKGLSTFVLVTAAFLLLLLLS
jgi:hypothetical protein